MKKMYKYILIISLMMFGFIGEVRAEEKTLCTYETIDSNKLEIIYESFTTINNKLEERYYLFENGKEIQTLAGAMVEISDYSLLKNSCPKHVWKKTKKDWLNTGPAYCFDNGNGHCTTTYSKYDMVEVELKGEPTSSSEGTKFGLSIPLRLEVDKCVENGTCIPLCSYEFKNNGYDHGAIIYYFSGKKIEDRYKVSASWVSDGDLKNIAFPNVYSSEAYIIENDLLKLMDEGMCPQNIYMDPDGKKEVCFDNGGGCITKSKFKNHEAKDTKVFTSSEMGNYLLKVKEERKNELSCEVAKEKIASKKGLNNITEICGYTRINPGTNEVRQFFVVTNDNKFKFFRYTLDGDVNSGAIEYIDEVTNIKKSNNVNYDDAFTCKSFNHFYTSASGNDPQWRIDEDALKDDNMYMFTCSLGEPRGYDKIENEITDCDSLLGTDLRNEINSWFLYIKIAVPIIVIVMGSLDFGKAFISSDEDAMKKAQKRFIMRIIIAMVIFFIPTILNALLNIGDQVWNISNGNGTCKVQF